jgi:fucose permease
MSSILLAIIYLAFISLGLPDSVLGVAWPAMRVDLAKPLEAAGIIAITLTSCSAAASFLSGPIVKKWGAGKVTLASCTLTGLGLSGYALSPSFGWVILSALPLGFGQGAVDSALNGYVAKHYASRHMNWLHASWGIGATLGPAIMTRFIAGEGWREGYRTLSVIQLSLAVLFLLTLTLWGKKEEGQSGKDAEGKYDTNKYGKRRIHGFNRIEGWIQIALYTFYAATEFTVGLWANSMLIESRGIEKERAGLWIALYYGGITVGRFLTGLAASRLGNRLLVRIGLGTAFAGALLLAFCRHPELSLAGLILIGIGLAPIYPCMMHETPERFDRHTYQTLIGFQVGAACLGGSFIPGLVGVVASRTSLEIIIPCAAGFLLLMTVLSEFLNRRT